MILSFAAMKNTRMQAKSLNKTHSCCCEGKIFMIFGEWVVGPKLIFTVHNMLSEAGFSQSLSLQMKWKDNMIYSELTEL